MINPDDCGEEGGAETADGRRHDAEKDQRLDQPRPGNRLHARHTSRQQPPNRYTGVVLQEEVPAEATLLMDLANSLDERSFTIHGEAHQGGEELSSAKAAAQLLRAHGVISKSAQLASAELAQLTEIRDTLRQVLAARAGHRDSTAIREFNTILARLPLTLQLDQEGSPYLATNTRGALGALSETIARFAAEGGWERLRMCAAPDCRWVFYDTSRNGLGRWCSMKVCGNRDKTRRYRERQAGA